MLPGYQFQGKQGDNLKIDYLDESENVIWNNKLNFILFDLPIWVIVLFIYVSWIQN